MVAVAVIGGTALAGSAIGAVASSSAADKAANVSQSNTNANNALAANIYDQNKSTLAPFVAQGGAATSYINQLLGLGGANPSGGAGAAFDAYKNSDGYQFRLNQGTQAVTNNAAAKGALNSGATLKALQTYGQNTASSEFNTYLGQLQGQQGVGLSAASAQAGVANTYSSQVQANNSTNATNQGNAAIAQGNAISNGVNGIANTASYLYGSGLFG